MSQSNCIQALKNQFCSVKSRSMDEHSMYGCPTWAWLKNIHEEAMRNLQSHQIIQRALIQEVLDYIEDR